MIKTILNKSIKKLGKNNYKIDDSISNYDLINIILSKLLPILRGLWLRLFLKESKGIVFLGKHTKIQFKSKIKLGKTITIGDNVEINALSKNGIIMGNNISINRNTIIECTGVIRNLGVGLVIGNNVGIAQNCFIQVRGEVIIGNNVIFGPGVSIFSENHVFSDVDIPIVDQGEVRKGVVIEDNVWIASGATILDGVRIGRDSVIAAGSVVNKDVLPYVVVGGVPAKIIKYRIMPSKIIKIENRK
jgi:acetyltransferase-like isoleucine patch superfamily enzyme